MSWIGLRDRARGFFNDAGLGEASGRPVDLNALLPKGSLMMSFAVTADMVGRPTTLLSQISNSQWLSTFKITLTKQGDILFRQTQGGTEVRARLAAGLLARMQDVLLTYTWDAPARKAMLSLHLAETDALHWVEIDAPMPLSLRDAIKLTRHPGGCLLTDAYDFLAVADHKVPHGPLPMLCPKTMIDTPMGLAPAGLLRTGDLVTLEDGQTAQVRWAGTETLPARGRFAPVTARAPYFGARRDLTVATHQRIELTGSEVEYLFATDRISVRVGDLPKQMIKLRARLPLTKSYCHILLDRPVTIQSGGLSIEAFDAAQLCGQGALRAQSALSKVPAEMLPPRVAGCAPRISGLETLTLCQLMAA